MSNDMFRAMNLVAQLSCSLMVRGIDHGIGPGEEALTDVNLIHLSEMVPSMLVQKFAKKAEAGNGADWEWWIGSSEDQSWLKLRIQAKRSSHGGVRYDQVGHTPKGHPLPQYDTLIAQSLKDGAIPFHVFFNGWPSDRYLVDTVRHDVVAGAKRASRDGYAPSRAAWEALHWGCTMVPTALVKKIFEDPSTSDFALVAPTDKVNKKTKVGTKDNRYVPRYLTHATPWAHLFWSDVLGDMPTFGDVKRNLYRMQGGAGDPPDDAFEAMTYRYPSQEAEQAFYGGLHHFEKSTAVEERAIVNDQRAREYLQALESSLELNQVLNGADNSESGPGYLVLTDLTPEANFYLNRIRERDSTS